MLKRLLAITLPTVLLLSPLTPTLADCICLTMKENRTIRNAYLDRVAQKYDLSTNRTGGSPR